jgi:glycosyltransferase involved in cell wall biosynthesis
MLLNCAPSEGYGLAMREAILSGTPVIALRNEGTSELKSKFPEMVFLFNTVDEAVREIKAHLGQEVSLDLVKKYRQEQAASDEIAVQSLIDSWR